jgi:hypothetical protein
MNALIVSARRAVLRTSIIVSLIRSAFFTASSASNLAWPPDYLPAN